jgi:DHA2 family multidrug resistance protein
MMPFIGKMIQRGVPQAYLVAAGFLTFSFYVLMQLVITPDSGEEHLYWPLILRGVGLGYYLYPFLHYHYQLKKGSIGEGAAFTGMMRN